MVFMNEFQVEMNDQGEYCLKNVSDYVEIPYKYLFEIFEKTHVTKHELFSFLNKNKKDPYVAEFHTKLIILEKCKWIEKAVSLMNKFNIYLIIDILFINLWTALESQTDIVIDSVFLQFMGFCKKDDCKDTRCTRKLIKFLKNNEINYKLKNSNSKSNCNISVKELVLTIDDFKDCIMELNFDGSRKVRKHFCQIEKVFNKYAMEELLTENRRLLKEKKDRELEVNELKRINSNMENELKNVKTRSKDGYIYIATSKSYAKKNLFKIGFTDNLKARLSGLNNCKTSSDRMYYCFFEKAFNVRKVEKIIHDILQEFRDSSKNEFFKLSFNYLSRVVNLTINSTNQPYEYVNKLLKTGIKKSCSLRSDVIPLEKKVEENDEPSSQELIDAITKLIKQYRVKRILKITRKQLFSDFHNELQCSLKQREMWSFFKKEFKWESSTKPINCGNYKIIVDYFNNN